MSRDMDVVRTQVMSYRTRIASVRGGAAPCQPGLTLAVGYHWPPDQPMPKAVVRIGTTDCSSDSVITRRAGDEWLVEVDQTTLATLLCANGADMYLKATATIDGSGRSFTGGVTVTCADQAEGAPYAWSGTSFAPGSLKEDAARFRRIVRVLTWL